MSKDNSSGGTNSPRSETAIIEISVRLATLQPTRESKETNRQAKQDSARRFGNLKYLSTERRLDPSAQTTSGTDTLHMGGGVKRTVSAVGCAQVNKIISDKARDPRN